MFKIMIHVVTDQILNATLIHHPAIQIVYY